VVELASLEDEHCVVSRQIDRVTRESETRRIERGTLRDELFRAPFGVGPELGDYRLVGSSFLLSEASKASIACVSLREIG
jgi:hypothetical protein